MIPTFLLYIGYSLLFLGFGLIGVSIIFIPYGNLRVNCILGTIIAEVLCLFTAYAVHALHFDLVKIQLPTGIAMMLLLIPGILRYLKHSK